MTESERDRETERERAAKFVARRSPIPPEQRTAEEGCGFIRATVLLPYPAPRARVGDLAGEREKEGGEIDRERRRERARERLRGREGSQRRGERRPCTYQARERERASV